MPRIRLLTSVAGIGAVVGDIGDELDVDGSTASAWADGVRAELVRTEPVRRAVVSAPEVTARRGSQRTG